MGAFHPNRVAAAAVLTLCTAVPVKAQHLARSWAVAVHPQPPGKPVLPDLKDRTLRQVVRISTGGARWHLRLSNEATLAETRVGSVHVSLLDRAGATVPGSDRGVLFGGRGDVTMNAASPLVSDAIDLPLEPLARVEIRIYLPVGAPAATVHGLASATTVVGPGDQTAPGPIREPSPLFARAIIEAIDVESDRPKSVVIAFGDSITDGARSTADANHRWPDVLADRLQRAKIDMGVANAGIGGNRLLLNGFGPNALARFDRDVIAVPGATHVVILEGINDIGSATNDKRAIPSAEAIIGAYRQMISRARAGGLKVIMGTLLPYKGAMYWSAEGEAVRDQVNSWIREAKEADGVVDFERAICDPTDPDSMRAEFDSGDHLHPNDAGYRTMANTMDLSLLR